MDSMELRVGKSRRTSGGNILRLAMTRGNARARQNVPVERLVLALVSAVSGVGSGTRNIRIGRIASSIVSTHPVIVGSGPVQSGVRISGNVCADRRKL
jgi:hypothetical protein